MSGEVFEILPNGERRNIGKVVSIEYGGLPARFTEVVVEISRDSGPLLPAKFQAVSMGVTYTPPTPKPPRNHYERRKARMAQQRARKRLR